MGENLQNCIDSSSDPNPFSRRIQHGYQHILVQASCSHCSYLGPLLGKPKYKKWKTHISTIFKDSFKDLQTLVGMYWILNPSPIWRRAQNGSQHILIQVSYSLYMCLERLLGKPTKMIIWPILGELVVSQDTNSLTSIGIHIPTHFSASSCMRTDAIFA